MPVVKRIDAVIPENRQLVLDVPPDVPSGAVEIIILSREPEIKGKGDVVLRYLAQHRVAPQHRRTGQALDAQIDEERSAWD